MIEYFCIVILQYLCLSDGAAALGGAKQDVHKERLRRPFRES